MALSIAVFGDALLDRDIDGRATHLAPDAPAPVVSDARSRVRPGGAALAAMLLARDGADVVLIAAMGDDPAARELERLLRAESIEVLRIAAPATTQKVRIRADGRMLGRLDLGEYAGQLDDAPLSHEIDSVIRT